MWRNFSTLQSVIWKNFSSWQIFSPQTLLVVPVTNIRYDHMEWVAGGPTKILRTNLVCNWPKNDPRTVWLAQCRKCNNLQEVRAETLGSPILAQEGYWNPKYSEILSKLRNSESGEASDGHPNFSHKGPITTKRWPKITADLLALSEDPKHLDQTGLKLDLVTGLPIQIIKTKFGHPQFWAREAQKWPWKWSASPSRSHFS